MKKRLYLLLVAMTLQMPVYALMPPLWEDVAQIEAILQDQHLKDHLDSGDIIVGINRTKKGWVIVTNHKKLPVKVQALPQSMPGPGHYAIEFGSAKNVPLPKKKTVPVTK